MILITIITTLTQKTSRSFVYKHECFPTVLGENREVIERMERSQTIDFLRATSIKLANNRYDWGSSVVLNFGQASQQASVQQAEKFVSVCFKNDHIWIVLSIPCASLIEQVTIDRDCNNR